MKAKNKKIDWEVLRAEYIATQTSYAKLAEKYGTSKSVVAEHGKREGWQVQRLQNRKKTAEMIKESLEEGRIEAIKNFQRSATIVSYAFFKIVKQMSEEKDAVVLQDFKAMTSVLRDIKELLDIRNPLDIEEQQFRIAKLKQDTESEGPERIEVVMNGVSVEDLKEYLH